jgi:hypothetical protein
MASTITLSAIAWLPASISRWKAAAVAAGSGDVSAAARP